MKVSPHLAQNIVESMKSIIKQDINFIDSDGTIIASTDPDRIGTFHEAGRTVYQLKRVLVISESDSYEGTRPGINLPVHINGEVIAVIGITGTPEQVITFGNIIRKMTEILILEEEFRNVKQREVDRNRMLLEDLIFYPQNFAERWDEATLSFWRSDDDYKRIVLIHSDTSQFNFLKDVRRLLEQYTEQLPPLVKSSILWTEHEQMMVLLYKEKTTSQLLPCLQQIEELKFNYPSMVVAIGSRVHRDFRNSYRDAQLVQDTYTARPEVSCIVNYDDLTIELLFNPENTYRQQQLQEKVLGQLTDKELEEFYHILQLFEAHNGSISSIADELFIHKNTLQYQIQKLRRITGYDLRNYHDFMVLRLAFTLYHHTTQHVSETKASDSDTDEQ